MKCAPFMNPVVTQVSVTVAVLRPVNAYTRPEEKITGRLLSEDIPAGISQASESYPGTGTGGELKPRPGGAKSLTALRARERTVWLRTGQERGQ